MSDTPAAGSDPSFPQQGASLSQQIESPAHPYEIDLVHLVRVIRKQRWRIAGVTAIFTAAGVAYAFMATPFYRAEAVLLPRDESTAYGLSGQLSKFAGLAELAGINVGITDKQEPLGVLHSKGFARRFIEENKLLGVLTKNTQTFARGAGSSDPANDIRRVVDEFSRSVMLVTEDKKSGLLILSVTWKDPDVAAAWANRLVDQVNDEMRLRALQESESNIRYLKAQLAKTDVVSFQQSISRALESEIPKAMFAQGTREYAFRVIDRAVPPALRWRPKRVLIVVLAFAAGLVLSTLIALVAGPTARLVVAARGD